MKTKMLTSMLGMLFLIFFNVSEAGIIKELSLSQCWCANRTRLLLAGSNLSKAAGIMNIR